MTIDELINQLSKAREQVGGNCEVPVVDIVYGRNDFILPSYVVVCDMTDQDGEEFKCAIVGEGGGEELTEKGIPHYEWDFEKRKVT